VSAESQPWKNTAAITIRTGVLYIVLTSLSVLFILPLVWMFSVSLQDANGIFVQPYRWIPEIPRWENYRDAVTIFPFGRYLLNTSVITISVVVLSVLSSSLVAYGFARLRFRGRDMLFAVCLSTMMLPGQVTMIPLYAAFARLGWIDTWYPLIVPALFGSPFYIFLFRQFFMSIPREYDEAALLDGAGRLRIYWSILLPLARPAVATVALFCFIGAWNDFFNPLIYINTPAKATLTLGLHMLKTQIVGTGSVQWHVLMAASLLVMLPNIAVFFLAQKHFVKGLQMGGLRG
jgi:multiple sugar transport system permease protein